MTTQTLATIQKSVQDFLLHEQGSLDSLTTASQTFSHAERIGIYSDGYRARLIEALENDYPAFLAFLGDEQFNTLASKYIDLYPSKNPSLRWLGEKLPAFLRESTHWQQQTGVQELARFEWAQIMAFDAHDIQPLTIEALVSLREEQWPVLKLLFHPSLQFVQCNTNAPDAWLELIKTENNNSTEIKLSEKPGYWIIWRKELQVLFRQLDDLEYQCLSFFLDHKTFGEVIETLSEMHNEEVAVTKTAQFLQAWIQQGLIQAINCLA